MPTSRPRHTLTETDELRELLDRARARFPDAPSRSALLWSVLRVGDAELRRREAVDREREAERQRDVGRLARISTGDEPGIDFDALERVRHEGYGDLA
jgi:hypothetical protein